MATKHERKKHGHHRLSFAEQIRRGRRIGAAVLGTAALIYLFYLVDRTGPSQKIDGRVVETHAYPHSGDDQAGPHVHIEAILEYEGHRYKLEPGDRFKPGDAVTVEVHRGRFTGYPYFVQAGHKEGAASSGGIPQMLDSR